MTSSGEKRDLSECQDETPNVLEVKLASTDEPDEDRSKKMKIESKEPIETEPKKESTTKETDDLVIDPSCIPKGAKPDGTGHGKTQFFFSNLPGAKRKQIKMDNEALFSITDCRSAEKMSKVLLNLPGITKESVVTDMTSCVGGNVISFSRYFKTVNAIEIDPLRFSFLKHNVETVVGAKNVNFICGNAVEILCPQNNSSSSSSSSSFTLSSQTSLTFNTTIIIITLIIAKFIFIFYTIFIIFRITTSTTTFSIFNSRGYD
mmetsp:Transcript_27917/g.33068  ORF Transcript_27917/g.33068 Transcript_27917/m.33068 type:complete len:261 (+) Transcript_27917:31-813(+)